MKTTLTYFIAVLFMLSIFIPKKAISQDGSETGAAIGGLVAAGLVAAIAIEQNKENMEVMASNKIFSDFPEYKEFRIKIIGYGTGGKKFSSNGAGSLFPFAFTELKNTLETNNRKLLMLFASSGWITQYGINFSKLRWEWWSKDDWNNLLLAYSELNSTENISIESNLIPIYNEKGQKVKLADAKKFSKSLAIDYATIESNAEDEACIRIGELTFTKAGWKAGNSKEIIYPFSSMQGDDYLITEYSENLKIFRNENALGLYFRKEKSQMLLHYKVVNKIHTFINPSSEELKK